MYLFKIKQFLTTPVGTPVWKPLSKTVNDLSGYVITYKPTWGDFVFPNTLN